MFVICFYFPLVSSSTVLVLIFPKITFWRSLITFPNSVGCLTVFWQFFSFHCLLLYNYFSPVPLRIYLWVMKMRKILGNAFTWGTDGVVGISPCSVTRGCFLAHLLRLLFTLWQGYLGENFPAFREVSLFSFGMCWCVFLPVKFLSFCSVEAFLELNGFFFLQILQGKKVHSVIFF